MSATFIALHLHLLYSSRRCSCERELWEDWVSLSALWRPCLNERWTDVVMMMMWDWQRLFISYELFKCKIKFYYGKSLQEWQIRFSKLNSSYSVCWMLVEFCNQDPKITWLLLIIIINYDNAIIYWTFFYHISIVTVFIRSKDIWDIYCGKK